MSSYSVSAKSLNKTFGRRLIFDNLGFDFTGNGIYGISGPNGSGKSTLVKIIGGLLSATRGKVEHYVDDKEIIPEKLHDYIGFVSPYLVLYDEFSAQENLHIIANIRGASFNVEKASSLLKYFLLYDRKDDMVKTYSSGMKQRLKFIFALMHSPHLLILDEPTSNLDEEGKESVYGLIKNTGEESIVIIASNEMSDLSLCTEKIMLEEFK